MQRLAGYFSLIGLAVTGRSYLLVLTILLATVVVASGCPEQEVVTQGAQTATTGSIQNQPAEPDPERLPWPSFGKNLPWRVLEQADSNDLDCYNSGGLVTGDFDGDGNEELLKISPGSEPTLAYEHGTAGQSIIFYPDGETTPVGILGEEFMLQTVSWDCDHDGIDEVAVGTSHAQFLREHWTNSAGFADVDYSSTLPVFSVDGSRKASLPFDATAEDLKTGDVDGDGFEDLIFPDSIDYQKKALGRDGEVIWQFDIISLLNVRIGDVDNDGRVEVIYQEQGEHHLTSIGYQQEKITVAKRDEFDFPLFPPSICMDLENDGSADLIYGREGIYSLKSRQLTRFTNPSALDDLFPMDVLILDINRDGDNEIVVSGFTQPGLPDYWLVVYGLDGKCKHFEFIPGMFVMLFELTSKGMDYLVMQTSDRLMIYP